MSKASIFTPGTHETRIMLHLLQEGQAMNADFCKALPAAQKTVSVRLAELRANGYVQSNPVKQAGRGAPLLIYGLTKIGIEEAISLEAREKRSKQIDAMRRQGEII